MDEKNRNVELIRIASMMSRDQNEDANTTLKLLRALDRRGMLRLAPFENLPAVARNSDPVTSKRAYKARVPKVTNQLGTMLEVFYKAGATLSEKRSGRETIAKVTGLTAMAASDRANIRNGWRRVSDLKRLGYIAPTGEIRKTRAGTDQHVLEITVEGIRAYSQMRGGS